MNPDQNRRELLKDELMLNENFSILDDTPYYRSKTWDDEIIEYQLDTFFSNTHTFQEYQLIERDKNLELF